MHSRADFRLPSKKVRALALSAIEKRVASRAADLARAIKQLRAAGNTTLRALAAGLNAMSITTARGGNWDETQVRGSSHGSEARPRDGKGEGKGQWGRREAGYAPF